MTYQLLLIFSLPLLLAAAPKSAASTPNEVVRGYLVDLVCVKEEADKIPDLGPNHTRKCLQMPACIQGGYAVLLPGHQVLTFDEHGNELVRKLVASRHQERGLIIKATGVRRGDRFRVFKIE